MDNFDLRKYLTEGKLLKENVDFPELEDEFEGAMDAMVVEPKVYLQDIINASPEEIVSDDYYEVMNAVEQGVYSEDEAVKLAKAWAKEKLSILAEAKQLKENRYDIEDPNSPLGQLNNNDQDVAILNSMTKKHGLDIVLMWLSSGEYGDLGSAYFEEGKLNENEDDSYYIDEIKRDLEELDDKEANEYLEDLARAILKLKR